MDVGNGKLVVTGHHVRDQALIGMPPLQLCLPHVVVRVDEARRDDLAMAVDRLSVPGGRLDALANLRDDVPDNKHVSVVQWNHMVV